MGYKIWDMWHMTHSEWWHTTLLLALPAVRVQQVLRLQVGISERKTQVVIPSTNITIAAHSHSSFLIEGQQQIEINRVTSIKSHQQSDTHRVKFSEWYQECEINILILIKWHPQSDIHSRHQHSDINRITSTEWPPEMYCLTLPPVPSRQYRIWLYPLHLSPIGANFTDQNWSHHNDRCAQ